MCEENRIFVWRASSSAAKRSVDPDRKVFLAAADLSRSATISLSISLSSSKGKIAPSIGLVSKSRNGVPNAQSGKIRAACARSLSSYGTTVAGGANGAGTVFSLSVPLK